MLLSANASRKPRLGAVPSRNHPLMRSCAAWWPFVEGGGNSILDVSGNANHGSYLNSENFPWVTGHPRFGGIAFQTFGIDELVDVPHSPSLDITGMMTISCWFRIQQAATDYDGLVFKSGSSSWNSGYGIYLTNDFLGGTRGLTFFIDVWNTNHADIAFDWSTDFNWHHVVGVYDKVNVSIYLDLVKGTDDPYTGSATSNTNTLQIGKSRDGATLYVLYCDYYDLRIWNRALNFHEIAQLYVNPWAPFKNRMFWPIEPPAVPSPSILDRWDVHRRPRPFAPGLTR